MKVLMLIMLIALTLFLEPINITLAQSEGLTIDAHGMRLECENKTRESHLYLMNAKKLELSAEQIRQLRDIKGGCNKVCIVEKVKFRIAKVELTEILEAKVIDMAKAKEKIKLISALQDSLRIIHLKAKVKAMMVLNEIQKVKAGGLTKSI